MRTNYLTIYLQASQDKPKKRKKEIITITEAVNRILPSEENIEKKPRLRTPSMMQAVLLPFYKVPHKPGEAKPTWNQPHLAQLKNEVIVCSIAMFVLPFTAFFMVQRNEHLIETYGVHKTNNVAALAAVGATQITIMIIVIVKYWEDFMIVMRGEGHLPYDKSLTKDSEYFQSAAYYEDLNHDAEKRKKRQKTIYEAKKKTEVEERPLFVGYFFGNLPEPKDKTKQERSPAAIGNEDSANKKDSGVVVQKEGRRKKKKKNFKNY